MTGTYVSLNITKRICYVQLARKQLLYNCVIYSVYVVPEATT
jgi:hypothetical protein